MIFFLGRIKSGKGVGRAMSFLKSKPPQNRNLESSKANRLALRSNTTKSHQFL